MNKKDWDIVKAGVDGIDGARYDSQKEKILQKVLPLLFEHDGFRITHSDLEQHDLPDISILGMEDEGFIAEKGDLKIIVEFKQAIQPLGVKWIYDRISCYLKYADRVIISATGNYSYYEKQYINRIDPPRLELLDIPSVKQWASKIKAEFDDDEVEVILRYVSDRFARLIAKYPQQLRYLEWRDLERMLAEIFEGIGYNVELTPPLKDGGKDLVLECRIYGKVMSYIVEVKHWQCGKKVGQRYLRDFIDVIVRENRDGGLFLSTSGYSENFAESLTQLEKDIVRFGNDVKIVSLCRTYVKKKSCIWRSQKILPYILFEDTLN